MLNWLVEDKQITPHIPVIDKVEARGWYLLAQRFPIRRRERRVTSTPATLPDRSSTQKRSSRRGVTASASRGVRVPEAGLAARSSSNAWPAWRRGRGYSCRHRPESEASRPEPTLRCAPNFRPQFRLSRGGFSHPFSRCAAPAIATTDVTAPHRPGDAIAWRSSGSATETAEGRRQAARPARIPAPRVRS